MTSEEFMLEVESGHLRSKKLLLKKGVEYTSSDDRLDQFKQVAVLNQEPATRSLWGQATKHVTSLASMVKNPTLYNQKQWREKITDLRNYTHLLDALLIDLGIH